MASTTLEGAFLLWVTSSWIFGWPEARLGAGFVAGEMLATDSCPPPCDFSTGDGIGTSVALTASRLGT
ncbi:hypothetical protein PR001_g3635 [Phytophthora rubi]|uniref:Ammonium transporter AmtB-like domain-containing protein n=1 Tax=Phytophthora rubi TaxID=129364 RepID=A0A6A3MK13_9STRA|nr:hypothetical protein PR002_g9485 [Phytophthora rubi]KAE9048996.1 hypothetical protein PR001_g3635 [Phytophthora rubi]